jgi:hypothetical protein
MKHQTVSRRAALQLALASATGALLPAGRLLAAAMAGGGQVPMSWRPPVVSFHLDRPYLDLTGTAKPYFPGGGAAAATDRGVVSEELWRLRAVFV